MAIPDIPVFSFRYNWREPLDENISFLTDVLRAVEGAEQRRKLRLTPRRSFDVDMLLTKAERTFWDLFMNDLGAKDVLCPLYWDAEPLVTPLIGGATDRINFDTTRRDWAYQAGGFALVQDKSALEYEVVEIAAVDASGVDLVDPVVNPWPMGTRITPLRRGKIESVGSMQSITAAVATVTARLVLKEQNPWTPLADPSPVYRGLPVFLAEPNWVSGLSVDIPREIVTFDNEVGGSYETFPLNRLMMGQQHRWFLPGKSMVAAFRDLVYRLSGRLGSFWLPTFKADFSLAYPAGSGDTYIEVQNVGYGLTGGPRNGREFIAIRHSGGMLFRQITNVLPGTNAESEILELDLPLGLALAPGQAHKISFMDTARFDTDEFTISHYSGINGHHESTASFRTFRNSRVPPSILIGATPTGVMGNDPCGIAGDTACPLFFAEFDGWDYEISRHVVFTHRRAISGLYAKSPEGYPGAGQGGAYGKDFAEKFSGNTGLVSWDARRFNMTYHLAPHNVWDFSYIGDWRVTSDMGLVNMLGKRGPKGDQIQTATIKIYWRHWSQPFPGNLAATRVTKANNTQKFTVPIDIDWREWRDPPP